MKAKNTPAPASQVPRRGFLKTGTVFATGLASLSWQARAQVSKNSKLQILHIGVGGIELAATADDVVRIHKGKIASMIGVEGGRQIGGSLAALRQYYNLGARYMTLTHNQTTEWADSATDDPKYGGLSPFGVTVVHEMNRIGMLVDLSHVSADDDEGRDRGQPGAGDLLPLVGPRAGRHLRNVPDDVLQLLPANGGVVMVNFVPDFISDAVWHWGAEKNAEEARLKAFHRDSKAEVEAGLKAWVAAHPRPVVTVATVADHIEHVAKVAGYDHVGIGGDMDGIPTRPRASKASRAIRTCSPS